MDMSFSYKPVLLKAVFDHVDEDGKIRIVDIVNYFIDFYEERKDNGLIAEKPNSIYQKVDILKRMLKEIFSVILLSVLQI